MRDYTLTRKETVQKETLVTFLQFLMDSDNYDLDLDIQAFQDFREGVNSLDSGLDSAIGESNPLPAVKQKIRLNDMRTLHPKPPVQSRDFQTLN